MQQVQVEFSKPDVLKKKKSLYIDPTIYCKSYTPVRRYLILPCLQKMQFRNVYHADLAFYTS